MLEKLRQEWPAIKAAPWSFAIVFAAVAGICWWAMEWRYGGVIERQENEIQSLKSGALAPPGNSSFPDAQVTGMVPRIVNTRPPLIENGKATSFYFGLGNKGPGLAREVRWISILLMIERKNYADGREGDFLKDRFAELEELLQKRPTQDLPVNEAMYYTQAFKPSAPQAEAILSGVDRIYMLKKFRWIDRSGEHEGQTCHWMNPPSPEATAVSWRNCPGQNFIK